MSLWGIFLVGAIISAADSARRRAAERPPQERADRPKRPKLRIGNMQDAKDGFWEGFYATSSEDGGGGGERYSTSTQMFSASWYHASPSSAGGSAGYRDGYDNLGYFVDRPGHTENRRWQTEFDTPQTPEDEWRAQQTRGKPARARRQTADAEREADLRAWTAQRGEQRARRRRETEARARARDDAAAEAEALLKKKRDEAAARADTVRKEKQLAKYEKAWQDFLSFTPEKSARFTTARDLIPWPTASGRRPVVLDEEQVRLFFVECSSSCGGDSTAYQMFVRERNRWHPDRMNQRIKQKGLELDEDTEKMITTISQIVMDLCAQNR